MQSQMENIKKALIIVQDENEKYVVKMLEEFKEVRGSVVKDIEKRVEIIRLDMDKCLASNAVEKFFAGGNSGAFMKQGESGKKNLETDAMFKDMLQMIK